MQHVEPIPYEEYVRLYRESAERYGFVGNWYGSAVRYRNHQYGK